MVRLRALRPVLFVCLVLMLVLSLASEALAASSRRGSVSVRGYYRKDGTYVRLHTRTAPDSNPYNNYSFPGNYNPNTGKIIPGNPETYLQRYYERRGAAPGLPSQEAPAANLPAAPAASGLPAGDRATLGLSPGSAVGGLSADPNYHRLLSEELARQLEAERQRAFAIQQQLDAERQRREQLEHQLQAERASQTELERRRQEEAEYRAWQEQVRAAQERIRAEALRREAEERLQKELMPRSQSAARPTPLGVPAGSRVP